ncbi:helix-turn-helix domain-containing protein, partial [bacterium]|nr:helix-turn-helix domain-containing protein [bacterium]
MSHLASAWAIKQTGLSMPAKMVLMILADYHNSADGGCYPSIATLAEMACCDERTVVRAVNELTVMGLVTRVTRTSANGRQTSNQYNLNLQISEMGDRQSPPTPPYLSPLEPVINKPSDITYRADLIGKNEDQEEPPDAKKVFWDEAVGMLITDYLRFMTLAEMQATVSQMGSGMFNGMNLAQES